MICMNIAVISPPSIWAVPLPEATMNRPLTVCVPGDNGIALDTPDASTYVIICGTVLFWKKV